MIDLHLAMRLKSAGLVWHPAPGDRFAVPQPELLGQVFTVSDMTIEVHQGRSGSMLGFNGTTEWALDSVAAADAVWLPAEHQLRELLGPAFRALRAGGGAHSGDGPAGDGGDGPAGGGGDGVPGAAESTGDGGDGPAGDGAFLVLVQIPGSGRRTFAAPVAEEAYALALLALIRRATT